MIVCFPLLASYLFALNGALAVYKEKVRPVQKLQTIFLIIRLFVPKLSLFVLDGVLVAGEQVLGLLQVSLVLPPTLKLNASNEMK